MDSVFVRAFLSFQVNSCLFRYLLSSLKPKEEIIRVVFNFMRVLFRFS